MWQPFQAAKAKVRNECGARRQNPSGKSLKSASSVASVPCLPAGWETDVSYPRSVSGFSSGLGTERRHKIVGWPLGARGMRTELELPVSHSTWVRVSHSKKGHRYETLEERAGRVLDPTLPRGHSFRQNPSPPLWSLGNKQT